MMTNILQDAWHRHIYKQKGVLAEIIFKVEDRWIWKGPFKTDAYDPIINDQGRLHTSGFQGHQYFREQDFELQKATLSNRWDFSHWGSTTVFQPYLFSRSFTKYEKNINFVWPHKMVWWIMLLTCRRGWGRRDETCLRQVVALCLWWAASAAVGAKYRPSRPRGLPSETWAAARAAGEVSHYDYVVVVGTVEPNVCREEPRQGVPSQVLQGGAPVPDDDPRHLVHSCVVVGHDIKARRTWPWCQQQRGVT